MAEARKMSDQRQAPKLITEIRKLGITQKQLEKKLGISQQAVSDYKQGKVKRERYDVIKKLQQILASAQRLPNGKNDIAHAVIHLADDNRRKKAT